MEYGQPTEQFNFDREILIGSESDDHDCHSSEEDGCDCADMNLQEEIEEYDN